MPEDLALTQSRKGHVGVVGVKNLMAKVKHLQHDVKSGGQRSVKDRSNPHVPILYMVRILRT